MTFLFTKVLISDIIVVAIRNRCYLSTVEYLDMQKCSYYITVLFCVQVIYYKCQKWTLNNMAGTLCISIFILFLIAK